LIGILKLMLCEPLIVFAEDDGKIVKFASKPEIIAGSFGECVEAGRRDAMMLQFAQGLAEFAGEAWQTCAGAEDFQFGASLFEQGAQNHDATAFRQQLWDRPVQLFKDKLGESFERENPQLCIARQIIGQKLAFELEGGLLRRQPNE
jgi:hypothetical protein